MRCVCIPWVNISLTLFRDVETNERRRKGHAVVLAVGDAVNQSSSNKSNDSGSIQPQKVHIDQKALAVYNHKVIYFPCFRPLGSALDSPVLSPLL